MVVDCVAVLLVWQWSLRDRMDSDSPCTSIALRSGTSIVSGFSPRRLASGGGRVTRRSGLRGRHLRHPAFLLVVCFVCLGSWCLMGLDGPSALVSDFWLKRVVVLSGEGDRACGLVGPHCLPSARAFSVPRDLVRGLLLPRFALPPSSHGRLSPGWLGCLPLVRKGHRILPLPAPVLRLLLASTLLSVGFLVVTGDASSAPFLRSFPPGNLCFPPNSECAEPRALGLLAGCLLTQ